MQGKQTKILAEIISNPKRTTFSRKNSMEADDLTSIILINPTLEKMMVLKQKCPNLEYLKLTKISDPQVIQPIKHMKKIQKLHLSILNHIKESVLSLITAHLKQLSELWIQIDGGALNQKEILAGQLFVNFEYNPMTTKAICGIVDGLPELRSLNIPGANIGNKQLIAISQIKNLKQLNLNENTITYQGLKIFMMTNPKLLILSLSQNFIMNKIFILMASRIPKIQVLILDGCTIDDSGALYISKLRQLKQLRLDFNKIQDISALRLITNLRKASLIDLSNNYLLSKRFCRSSKLKNRIWQKVVL